MPDRSASFRTEVWSVDSIRVGERRRRSLGDFDGLAASIEALGLLHPPLVSSDGVLLCGARRLAAVRALGWTDVEVRIHPNASTPLSVTLAEQHENGQRLDLLPSEEARLFIELRALYQVEAAQQQSESRRRGSETRGAIEAPLVPSRDDGGADSAPAHRAGLKSRQKAALAITGKLSHQRLEQIGKIIEVSEDPDAAWHVRRIAETALAAIDDQAPVDPNYRRVLAALTLSTLPAPADIPEPPMPGQPRRHASEDEVAAMSKAAEELARARRAAEIQAAAKRRLAEKPVQRSVRALFACVQELDSLIKHYDEHQVAGALSAAECEVLQHVDAFLRSVAAAREALATDDGPALAEAV